MAVPSQKSQKQVIAIVNDETNDIEGYEDCGERNTLGVHWVATFQTGMMWLAQQDITGEQLKVFLYLIGQLSFDNWLRVKQSEISDHLNISQSHVSRALKKLLDLDVIAKGPMAGRFNTYRLNPRLAHRGAKHYKSNIVQYDELKRRAKKKGESVGEVETATGATN